MFAAGIPPQAPYEIERWHERLDNHILLESRHLRSDFETQIDAFDDHHNSDRCRNAIGNPPQPMSASALTRLFCWNQARINRQTSKTRHLMYRGKAD